MKRIEELFINFRNEQICSLFEVELLTLEKNKAVLRLPVKEKFLTSYHCVLAGGIMFVIADIAAAYAAMTRMSADEKVFLKDISEGRFLEPIIAEEEFAVVEAGVLRGDLVSEWGRERKKVYVEVWVKNLAGVAKAYF